VPPSRLTLSLLAGAILALLALCLVFLLQ